MYNFEYYGFSLLCYIQRECNSHFRERGNEKERAEFSGSDSKPTGNIAEVNRVLNYELRRGDDPTSSGRPSLCVLKGSGEIEHPGYIDYSRSDEVAELDLVSKWYPETMRLPDSDIKALGDACYELGLAGVLWQISQWTPDRKRGALVMVDDSGPSWSRGRVIAASISDKSFSLGLSNSESKRREFSESLIRVKSSEMERLCIRFNEIRLERQ